MEQTQYKTKIGPSREAVACACGSTEFYSYYHEVIPVGHAIDRPPAARQCADCGDWVDSSPDSTRIHDWVTTFSGRRFHFLNPRAEDVCLQDLAVHLANCPRFAGATWPAYSVAQHLVIVSLHVEPRLALRALLHDGAEYVMGDMVGPLKRLLPQYKEIELTIQAAIYQWAGLPVDDPEADREIKQADIRMLATERRDIAPTKWEIRPEEQVEPYAEKIAQWLPGVARTRFRHRFEELTPGAH